MKNIMRILLTIIILSIIVACDKDENEPNEVKLEKTTISAKWIISNSSDYESFEFNESGNYIVVKDTTSKTTNDQVVLFGTYEIIEGEKIALSDFGTLTISEINENSISFFIQLTSKTDNEVIINASKQEEIESSTNTDLLCKSWELVSLGGDAKPGFYVLFSKAGTYLVKAGIVGEEIIGLGTWTWCNTDENKIAFTMENILDCDGIEIIKDIQLTSSSFIGIDMENGEPLEIIMESVSSSKSVRLANIKTRTRILGLN